MKESKVQKDIIDYLHKNNAWTVKTKQNNVAGVSDIIACYKGYFISLEVKKSEKEKASLLQLRQGKKVVASGGIFAVVWSVEQVEQILKNLP